MTPGPNVRKWKTVVVALMTREQALEAQWQEEAVRHIRAMEDLQRAYLEGMAEEKRRHDRTGHEIQDALEGKRVPGICPTCGQGYRTFHQWDDLEQCPHCGADLSGGSES